MFKKTRLPAKEDALPGRAEAMDENGMLREIPSPDDPRASRVVGRPRPYSCRP